MKPAEILEKIERLRTHLTGFGVSKNDLYWLEAVEGLVNQSVTDTGLEEGCWVALKEDYIFAE